MKLSVNYIRCHGSGNRFFLVDLIEQDHLCEDLNLSDFTKTVCCVDSKDRVDGVLFVVKEGVDGFRMRMFNTDGSESEMCGNGMRCCARYLFEKYSREISIVASGDEQYYVTQEPSIFEEMPTYGVVIPASIDTDRLPLYGVSNPLIGGKIEQLDSSESFTAISVGNPHVVSAVDSVDLEKLISWGERVLTLTDSFPQGVNVSQYAKLSDNCIFVSTFERGVGHTLSCGTAMTSSSVASVLLGLCQEGSEIEVCNAGGKVKCIVSDIESDIRCKLIGNATFTSEVELLFCTENIEITDLKETIEYQDEITLYDRFVASVNEELQLF